MMAVGTLAAGIVGFFTIRWLIGYITNHSLLPFAIYCLILGIGTLILTAVNPSTPTNYEIKSVKPFYIISYSSSVQWMLPIINECGGKIPDTTILLNQSEIDISSASRDIHISYGELSSNSPYIYQLGDDYLVPAAHQDNPIINLTLDALRGIYQGKISTIKKLTEECAECVIKGEGDITPEESIQVWGYPEESFLYKAFQSAVQMDILSPNLSIAPNPYLLQQVLSLEAWAVGILPQEAISDQLKSIPVIDMPIDQASIQILAVSHKEPDTVLTALLVCLQEEIIE